MTEQGKPDYAPTWAFHRIDELAESDPHNIPGTNEEWARKVDMWRRSFARYVAANEPEPPVDPLLAEARELCANACDAPSVAAMYRAGDVDNAPLMKSILAALRRGMELRPQLTRERVREAAHSAIRICDTLLGLEDFHSDASQHDKDNLNGFLDRLHAALTDGGNDD